MKIVVIGLGSMGKRRIRLILELYPEFEICGVDGRADRREEVWRQSGIDCYESVASVSDVSCAFVCTSPLAHAAMIRECLENGWHVFTELNLVANGYEENIKLAREKNCQLFLSSTFLYREETRYICSRVRNGGKWNYIYHIGQYLPDWHPWENYKDFFIGDRRTNGCREIFAIELPWLMNAFGDVKETHVQQDRLTGLDIAFNDSYMVQIVHENGCRGLLAIDVVSPCAVRRFEAYAEGAYIAWSGTGDSFVEYDGSCGRLKKVALSEKAEHCSGYASFVAENAYKNEIRAFFDAVEQKKKPVYGFEEDKRVLCLLDAMGV